MQEDNMSQYNLSLNTTFQPFTYEEMLKPVLLATQEHRVIEEGLATLEEEAAIWDKLANSAVDQDTYQVYKNFSDEVEAEAAQLAQYGLDPQSRRRMLKMKSKYKEDIAPIELAWKAREAEAKLQQDAYTKDKTVRFEQGAYDTPLSSYMNNPTRMTNHVSGTQVYNDVLKAASLISQQLNDYSINGKLDAYHNKVLADYGIDAKDVQRIINKYKNDPEGLYEDPEFNQVMGSLVQGAINRSGINDWKDKNSQYYKDTYNMLFENGLQGLYGLIGKDDPSHITNTAAVKALEARYKDPKPPADSGVYFGVEPFYSRKERTKAQQDYNNFKNYLIKDTDGNYTLSKKGLENYYTKQYDSKGMVIAPYGMSGQQQSFTSHSPFKAFIYNIAQQVNWTKEALDALDDLPEPQKKRAIAGIMKEFSDIDKTVLDPTDASKKYRYTIDIPSEDLEEYLGKINITNTKEEYNVVDYDRKTNSYTNTGETITKDQLLTAKAGRLIPSRYGNTLRLTLNDDSVVEIEQPSIGYNQLTKSAEANMQASYIIQDILNGVTINNNQLQTLATYMGSSIEDLTEEIQNAQKGDPGAIQLFNAYYRAYQKAGVQQTQQQFGSIKVEPAKVKTVTYN